MSTAFHFDMQAIYLVCFGVGLVLSVLAFAGGFFHLHVGHWHVGGHGRMLSRSVAQGAHGAGPATLSPMNGFTIVAFLCWFGGTGFLLTHGRLFPALLVLLLAAVSGLSGAGLIFWFLAKVILPHERTLEPEDTPMIGVLGRVSARVPATGVGEMLYTQGGARRSMPVCAEDGVAIEREAEVVVLRYQRGIGYVRRWDELQLSLMGNDAPLARNAD